MENLETTKNNATTTKPARAAKPKPAKAVVEPAPVPVPDPGDAIGDNVIRLNHETMCRAVEFYLNSRIFRVPVAVDAVEYAVGVGLFQVSLGEQ